MKLTVALAVFNEEQNLARCLKSVKDLADEIVVVDGGSFDRTVEIAQQFGAKVIKSDNPPIFHINKQKALDASSGEWILQLDADEELSPQLREEIKSVISSKNSFNGYFLKRRNFFLGTWLKKGGQYPDPVIRLIKKGKGYFPCQSVHEQIVVDGEPGTLTNDLLHYTAESFSRYLQNSNRYTSLTAREYEKEKIPANALSNFKYLFFLPAVTFLKIYFRHKGLVDGFPGLIFAIYSGLHIRTSYVKYWEKQRKK